MALVDYSDSDSDAEQQGVKQPPPPKPVVEGNSGTKKKPFQKLTVTSSTTTPGGGGAKKILVNLPSSIGADGDNDVSPEEPPAKRAKTTATGSNSRFSSFGSFLPPPKKRGPAPIAGASASASAPSTRSAPAPGVHLKTAAEPAFDRRSAAAAEDEEEDGSGHQSEYGGGLNLPAPKAPAGPSIPAGQKPEGEVKLVGKPLMFKPLSVARRAAGAGKKKTVASPGASRGACSSTVAAAATGTAASGGLKGAAVAMGAPPKKKVSLFSTDDDDDNGKPPPAVDTGPSGAYEPLFTNVQPTGLDDHDDSNGVTGDYEAYAAPPTQYQQQSAVASASSSVSSIVDGMHLSEKAQRELFGRRGGGGANRGNNNGNNNNDFAIPANARVISFNMEKEYEHNEALRASGEQVYNPVRSIAPGKHSLRQMVNMAQNNQSALEDSFAQGRNNKKDAAGRYGWK